MITKNEEKFLEQCLSSVKNIVDEIVIVDTGSTDKTKEIAKKFNAKIYDFKWIEDFSAARNESLKYATKDWVLVLDADEVLSDNSFKLKDMIQSNPFDVYNIEMIHFIWNLSLIDNTYPQHYVNYRMFKVTDKLFYDEVEHPLLKGWTNLGQTNEVKIFHFGYIKGIPDIVKKYNNHVRKSNIHNREFLDQWKLWHVFGGYPVRDFTDFESLPSTIKKEIGYV